ncbi:MAG TPA: MFS transporter [Candidatus Kryptonia bacterium]|nr:MFS transporter [Candidatus Kryptonia bacterium]
MASEHSRALRILFLCLVCIGLGQSMLFSILPPAAREIGLSPFQVSTIFATSAALWVFVSPWWGRRSDAVGRRPIILIGLLGYALSMSLLATMIKLGLAKLLPAMLIYPLMVGSRSMFALFGSGTGPASQAYVADRTSVTERTAGVALVNAAMGLGETVGPGIGAALAAIGLLTPLYLSAGLAVISAAMIWFYLPEKERPHAHLVERPRKLSFRDPRVWPFLLVATSLQAVRATTVITFAFFLQDTLKLTSQQTVQYSGIGFVTLAVSGLFAQLVVVQRFQPSARLMIRAGTPLMLAAFLLFVTGRGYATYLMALVSLGLGIGLVRPGNAAAASLAVEADEQGSAAGVVGGVSVIGNVFGPMLGTKLYQVLTIGPYLLNAAVMASVLVYLFANPRLRMKR